MLLIHTERLTNRLGYTLNLIFKEILSLPFCITTKTSEFLQYKGAKISYGNQPIGDAFFISAHQLLFETSIETQEIHPSNQDGYPIFFETHNIQSEIPFDLFAASFYLVSRYEEYLPFVKDEHDRFPHSGSLAYQHNFLHKPLVNHWALMLEEKLKRKYPQLSPITPHRFSFHNTIDIDQMWLYRGKNIFRHLYGISHNLFTGQISELKKRFKVLILRDPDPYDTFDFLLALQNKYKHETTIFFLFAPLGAKDRNVSTLLPAFRNQIRNCGDYAALGIHPSYASFGKTDQLKEQIAGLEEVIHTPITKSRFHYLRMQLPHSYRMLIEQGIEEDYSMGYAGEIGFRASICTPHAFYDLEQDVETNLKVYPFAIMDSTFLYQMKKNTDETWELIKKMIDEVVSVKGMFISIWHNETISEVRQYKGWKVIYEKMVAYAAEMQKHINEHTRKIPH